MGYLLFALFFWVIPIVIGYRLGERKGRTTAGVLLTVFLGWLGVLAVGLMTYAGKKCPACAEKVREDANVCRHCGHSFAPGALAATV